MNRLTVTIESHGAPDATLIPMHAGRLKAFFHKWDHGMINQEIGEMLFDYDNIKVSWNVERGVKDTF